MREDVVRAGPLEHADEGDGTPIVLLHPVGLDYACWDGVAAQLSGRFRVLRPSLPGHGESPNAPPDATLEDYAEAVRAWLDAVGCGSVTLVGLSFGGMIAQTFALAWPERLRALVISGCPSGFPDDAARTGIAERGRAAEQGGMEAVVPSTLERWFTQGFRAAGYDAPTAERLRTDSVDGWARAWRAISGLDLTGRLAEIGLPTLCIAGELDAAAPPAALSRIAEAIPGAELKVLPGAPHMMQIECPAAYAEAIADFVNRRAL